MAFRRRDFPIFIHNHPCHQPPSMSLDVQESFIFSCDFLNFTFWFQQMSKLLVRNSQTIETYLCLIYFFFNKSLFKSFSLLKEFFALSCVISCVQELLFFNPFPPENILAKTSLHLNKHSINKKSCYIFRAHCCVGFGSHTIPPSTTVIKIFVKKI